MKNFSTALKVLAVILGISVFAFVAVQQKRSSNEPLRLGTVNYISDRNFQDAIGSASSPSTLTSTYTSSTPLRIPGLSNLVVAGTYTPKAFGSNLFIVLERSIDNGQTYYPYQVITPSTDRVSVWSNSFATSSQAVPFLIPGSGSSQTNVAIPFSFDTTLAADYVRLAVKESTTSTAGTVNVQFLSTNH